MAWIIVTGNPFEGYSMHGPFDTREDAVTWATKNGNVSDTWWASELQAANDDGEH